MKITGQELKNIRQKLTLTLEQVAEETRIKPTIIESIENDDTGAITDIYLNAYKKTLSDFYNKAENNKKYLASVKNVAITISFEAPPPVKEKKIDKPTEQIQTINDATVYAKYEAKAENNFTSVLINPKDIEKTINSQVENNSEIETIPTNLENIVEIKDEENTNTTKKKIKQQSFINFNKKILKSSLNITIKDLLIYLVGAVVIAGIIFFVFVPDSDYFFNNNNENKEAQYSSTDDSLIAISSADKDLYTYFENDSIVLTANCKDTAYVKVEIDNKKTDDVLMPPGIRKIWTASDKIILTTSNIGGIDFYKNDTLLPMLGPKGTMVQNIVITKEGIKNVNPLSTGNNPVAANELHPNQTPVSPSPSVVDAIKPPPKQNITRVKKSEPPKPIIIDFSKPVNTKPSILEEKKEKED